MAQIPQTFSGISSVCVHSLGRGEELHGGVIEQPSVCSVVRPVWGEPSISVEGTIGACGHTVCLNPGGRLWKMDACIILLSHYFLDQTFHQYHEP